MCCPAPLAACGNHSGEAERNYGISLKLFGSIPEPVFTFIPESCSGSSRNTVRHHPGIAFTLSRIPHTVGYQVFVCQNMAFQGDFEPVLAKHSKKFSLQNALSIGVDSMQRNFKPMVESVDRWRESQPSSVSAKLMIYQAFVEGELEVPRHLDRRVHDLYFNPTVEEFHPRTMWSLSNAFTSAFKELDPIPQFKATGKLAGFLQAANHMQ